MQILIPETEIFDAVVVGSGATGGWAAKQLTEAGLRVAMLEAGSDLDPAEFSEHVQPYQMKYRDQRPNGVTSPEIARQRPIQALQGACAETNHSWYVNDVENPYTTPEGMPFYWIRLRKLGGRSLAWGRHSYRMSDLDFRAASHDGYGVDWPVSYAEMAPHYSTVERYIGVSGEREGLAHFPDGDFQPPMARTCGEKVVEQAIEKKFRRPVAMGRTAVLTQPLNGRAACHYCGPCNRGCVTNSYYASPFTTVAAAQKTGRLSLVTDAVVSHITVDKNSGLANGVAYLDRLTRAPRELRAKAVVLCASTLESTRILLNSAPGGLANSSGALGRYLMDHLYGGAVNGRLPHLDGKPWHGAPRRPTGLFLPRFRNVDRPHTNGMIRGYSYQGSSGPQFAMNARGFGANFKKAVREESYWNAGLHGFSECLPYWENFAEIDKNRVDAWGIPVLKIHMKWRDNELALFKDCLTQGAEMLEAAGVKDIRVSDEPRAPGFGIHEVGTARMGADPRRSVLNKHCQTHDIKNIFVTDGAAHASIGTVNPTLTMMANTVKACSYLVEEFSKGNLA